MLRFSLLLASLAYCANATFSHSWDTVRDVMGMHGKYKELDASSVTQADIEFIAKNYPMVTTGTSCSGNGTIEDSVLGVAARIKAINPDVLLGMYWRSPFALELAECSGFASDWNAHPEWRLKDDAGKVIAHGGEYFIDYSQPAVQAFFADVLVNVTLETIDGKPILDYVYVDGGAQESSLEEYQPGIGPQRSKEIVDGLSACLTSAQQQLDANGHGQGIIINAMDTTWGASWRVGTGAAGAMFDHFSILQFVNRSNGTFNITAMQGAIELATSPLLSNFTTQVKGWPGPITHQRDMYPPNIPTPTTPAEFQAMSAARFNSELALFLLVASELDFWVYSFFWDWTDYVPNHADSTVPATFFPEASCLLGAPTGPAVPVPGTFTYKRQFAHASVFVDLMNRTASNVQFSSCP